MRRLLPCSLPGLRDSLESRIGVRGKPRGPHSLGLRPAGRPTHPANFQGRRKTTLCRPLVARSGEAIAMAGYAALATTAATHDGTLNIEGRWSSARNQCVLILWELGAKPTQCSSFFTLAALRADLALKLTRYCGTPAPMSPTPAGDGDGFGPVDRTELFSAGKPAAIACGRLHFPEMRCRNGRELRRVLSDD
jgi:hypothetical protein